MKLLVGMDSHQAYEIFQRLFDEVRDSQTIKHLNDLYFSVFDEKKNALNYLKDLIILNTVEEVRNYKDLKKKLVSLNVNHEKSEVWLYNETNFLQMLK